MAKRERQAALPREVISLTTYSQLDLYLAKFAAGELGLVLLLGRQLTPHLDRVAQDRAADVLAAHTRVRHAAQAKGRIRVEPVLPPDLLGCFILLPND